MQQAEQGMHNVSVTDPLPNFFQLLLSFAKTVFLDRHCPSVGVPFSHARQQQQPPQPPPHVKCTNAVGGGTDG